MQQYGGFASMHRQHCPPEVADSEEACCLYEIPRDINFKLIAMLVGLDSTEEETLERIFYCACPHNR